MIVVVRGIEDGVTGEVRVDTQKNLYAINLL